LLHLTLELRLLTINVSTIYAGSEERIIGGEAVQDSSIYPWMVAIVDDADSTALEGFFCAGMLVSPYLVITAAHCVLDFDERDSASVIIGAVDLENIEYAEVISIDSSIIYPQFLNSWIDDYTFVGGDVGFLVLSDSSNIVNTYISIIDDETQSEPGDSVTVIGWSTSEPDSLASILKYVQFPIQPLDTCKNNFSAPSLLFPEIHVCAGNDDGDGPCHGDSGGPMVVENSGNHILAGIISSGTNGDCAYVPIIDSYFYGIFTNVFGVRGWVNSVINGDTFTNVSFTNKDEQENNLSDRLRIDSYYPMIASGDTAPVPVSSSLNIDTHSQLLSDGTFQHYRWNSNYSDYKLSHDRVFTTQITEDIARFKTLDSILITNDHEIIMSIKDPWYVYQEQQNNQFYSLSDSTYDIFLNQLGPAYSQQFYALKTQQYVGTDSLWFDKWQAYSSNGTIDTSEDWAVLSTPDNYDSCMVIFKLEHAKVKALFVDVSGAPDTPTNFSIDTTGIHPVISWSPNSEKDIDHYRIMFRYWNKSDPGDGWFLRGTTTDTSYTDIFVAPPRIDPDSAAYKISAVDYFDNISALTDSLLIPAKVLRWPARENANFVSQNFDIPDKFVLTPAYPNPFNPKVSIRFGLPEDGDLIVSIYNSVGQKIDDLSSGYFTSGYHSLTWDGNKYPSGIYLIRIDSDRIHETQKVILLK